jgi:hypothetical protein
MMLFSAMQMVVVGPERRFAGDRITSGVEG